MNFSKLCSLPALALIGALLLPAIAPKAQAQFVTYNLTTVMPGGTNNIAAATTNTYTSFVIPVTRSSTISIQPTFSLLGSGTSPVVLRFDRSVDSLNWEPVAHSASVTANGTSVVTAVTSVTLNSTGYLRLSVGENPNAHAVTNLTVVVSTKSGL